MAGGYRLMAVHAHPDDESSKGCATMARYLAEGDEVVVVTCTGGERGDVLNPRLMDDPQVKNDLVALRRAEMERAKAIVGFEQVWLGFVDSGLPEGDPLPPLPEGCFALTPLDTAVEALVRVIREKRPHVITTYDENGGYPHPDHIRTHDVTVAAVRAAGDATAYPDAGEAWQPLKVYYDRTFSKAKLEAYHDVLVRDGRPSPFPEWLERRSARPEGRITTRVRCDEWFEVRTEALLAYATQIDPDGMFFALSPKEQAESWPVEDWDLVLSAVAVPSDEDDLFASLGSPADADALATSGAATMVIDDVVEREEN